jgi:bifunctional non-homologous end joining protein LigD
MAAKKKKAKRKAARPKSLARYDEKRDFTKTAEPRGSKSTNKGNSFCIQKHDASRLHYDFRLEHKGVLLSWAVPKGPSLNPADRRLAVRTEDHPIEYGKFEGTIPKGQYGGGTVMLWDRGIWASLADVDEGLRRGSLKFLVKGERVLGGYALVRMPKKRGEKGENWLLIKERDDFIDEDGEKLVREERTSISTKRSMEEIAAGKKPRKR